MIANIVSIEEEITAFYAGDESALESIMERTMPLLRKFAKQESLRSRSDVFDLIQAGALRVTQDLRRRRYDPSRGRWITYLYVILPQAMKDAERRGRLVRPGQFSCTSERNKEQARRTLFMGSVVPESIAAKSDYRRDMDSPSGVALAEYLEPAARNIMLLRLNGKLQREVAKILGCTKQNVDRIQKTAVRDIVTLARFPFIRRIGATGLESWDVMICQRQQVKTFVCEGVRVDQRFSKLAPELSNPQFDELERQHVLAGGHKEPFIVWRGYLLADFERFCLTIYHGIPFETERMQFDSGNAAFEWCVEQRYANR